MSTMSWANEGPTVSLIASDRTVRRDRVEIGHGSVRGYPCKHIALTARMLRNLRYDELGAAVVKMFRGKAHGSCRT
jgi:hypothetical protein